MTATTDVPHTPTAPPPSQPTPPQTPAKKKSDATSTATTAATTAAKNVSRPYSTQRLLADLTPNDDDERACLDAILNQLKTNPNFRWNWQTGKVHYQGRTRQNSNIKSLLADALADRRQLSTKADFEAMKRILRE
jgi:hypothetical protein